MTTNRLSLTISETKKDAINQKTTDLAGETRDINVVISKDELKSLSQIADGRLPFVEKSAQYAVSNPEHLPAIVDADEFQTDFKAFKDLQEIARPIRQLLDGIEKAIAVSGSESYDAARNYYKMAQLNASLGVPGAQLIVDDLRQLFDNKSKPETQPNP